MPKITAKNKNKFELYLAFLTLILFFTFFLTPYLCKTYLNENFNTVIGTVLGTSNENTKLTKETIKEQVDKIILDFIN